MKVKHLLITLLWSMAVLLAWRSGRWQHAGTYGETDALQHDEMFHMHDPLHPDGKVSMTGQFHLELASHGDGLHQLWISNAFRQEMDPAGFHGTLRIEPVAGEAVSATFSRTGRGKELIARTGPLEGQAWLIIDGALGEMARFDDVRFFWDYDPATFRLRTPPGLDPMIPIPVDNAPTARKVELGRELFFDPLLSHDSSVSCATCHRPEYAFAEPLAVSEGVDGRLGVRNAPTLLNVAYSPNLLWDGRSASLELQAIEPILNPDEMGNENEAELVARLDAKYGLYMQEVMGVPLSLESIAQAIACYERTLLSGDSDFDRFESGDREAIGAAAQRGRALFFGSAGCGDCHVPPLFTDHKFHNLGVGGERAESTDQGRYEVTGEPADTRGFKTPSLRDVTLTAPYMHDGSIATLRDVLEFYNRGGGLAGEDDPAITPLGLTEQALNDLHEFMKTLEGRVNVQNAGEGRAGIDGDLQP